MSFNETFVVLISILIFLFRFSSDNYRKGNVPSGIPYYVLRLKTSQIDGEKIMNNAENKIMHV